MGAFIVLLQYDWDAVYVYYQLKFSVYYPQFIARDDSGYGALQVSSQVSGFFVRGFADSQREAGLEI